MKVYVFKENMEHKDNEFSLRKTLYVKLAHRGQVQTTFLTIVNNELNKKFVNVVNIYDLDL